MRGRARRTQRGARTGAQAGALRDRRQSTKRSWQRYSDEGWLTIVGDATQEKVLREVHIERARGLVAATTTDATNIYIILTARSLNSKLKIIARASEEDAEKHLLTAGANHVVSPYNFAGYRIAQTFMRPHVVDFFDTAMNQQLPLEIEEVQVQAGSRFAGQTLETSRIRQEMGVIVLAIKGEDSQMRFNPLRMRLSTWATT